MATKIIGATKNSKKNLKEKIVQKEIDSASNKTMPILEFKYPKTTLSEYLKDKLTTMDFTRCFLSLNFEGLSIIIDSPNFSFSLSPDGLITYRRIANPAIEIVVLFDNLQFISRGIKKE